MPSRPACSWFAAPVVVGLLLVAVLLPTQCASEIIVHHTNGSKLTFPSVAIKYDGNSLAFPSLTALLWRSNVSDEQKVGSIIPGRYIPPGFRFIDSWLVWAMRYRPAALIVHSVYYSVPGGSQGIRPGLDTSAVTVPVVEIVGPAYAQIQSLLDASPTGYLNLTINDVGINEFTQLKQSWWFPFMVSTLLTAEVAISVFAAITLKMKFGRNLASLCLGLLIVSNLIRILYAIDPFWNKVFANGLTHLWFTASIPWLLGATIILGMYWSETASKNSIGISPLLTRTKFPAVGVISVLTIFEVISVSFRVANTSRSLVSAINSAIYVSVTVVSIVWFTYVWVKVVLFIKGLSKFQSRHELIAAFSRRAAASAFGLILLIIFSALTLTPWYATPFGESFCLYMIHMSLNWVALWQSLAFFSRARAGASSASKNHTNSSNSVNSVRSSV